jgi:protocatechuate 3,4-dioxygenase beta subunit
MSRPARLAVAALAIAAAIVLVLVQRSRDRAALSAAPPAPGATARTAAAGDTAAATRAAPPDDGVVHEDDRAGTLRLEGQVLDAGGAPVGGASVLIDSRPARTAVTEADGTFAFDRLLGRPYEVVATAGDQVAGPLVARLTETSEPVVLRLGAGAEVEVAVTADGGAPIAGAKVELHGLVDRDATADATGVARLRGVPGGPYQVAAAAPGYARASTWTMVTSGSHVHRLVLRRGAPVSGRVVDPAGAPVAGARVRYEGASDWAQASSAPVTTDADGAFTIDAMPAGSFRFGARHDAHAPGTTEAIALDGATARGGVEIRLAPGGAIAGVVVDRAGTPVAWARVRAGERMQGLALGRTREATAGADGAFRIAALPRGTIDVVALADAATSETTTLELRAAEKSGVRLVLALDAIIAGTVVDSAGEPIEGAPVWAVPEAGGGAGEARLRGDSQVLTDGAGRFTFRGLAAGAYALHAGPRGSFDVAGFELREEVHAQAGDTAVRIVVPADGAISGKVAFADGRAPAVFAISLGAWASTVPVSARDGTFTLRDLPPREYRLIVRGPGFTERALPPIAVRSGETADAGTITVDKGRSISGRVVDADGRPVERATVVAGAILWGTGSSPTAPTGVGGPPGSGLTKTATTDARGEFTVVGVGRGTRHLVADHEARGRSIPITIPGTTESAMNVQLALVPLGALEGTVTSGDAPASRLVVTAQPKTGPKTMFSVITGPDGSYRFDRLAADTYVVSVMLGADPMRGLGFHSRTVKVAPGPATRIDLAVAAGDVTLVVTPVVPGGTVSFALVESLAGAHAPRRYGDLEQLAMARDGGSSSFGMSFGGRPVRIERLAPGVHTVCAAPYPTEVGMLEGEEYMLREGDNLPVFCKTLTITPRPAEQTLELEVAIPPYVPAPPDDPPG